MSKDKISDYSATANSNTDIGGINIDEGCAPSGINDAIRTLMKQLKDWQSGSQDVYIHPAGSASVPSITATGDTNTGLFFPAADTVGITTGGSERARVDSSGNLGLGVTPSSWQSGRSIIELGGSVTGQVVFNGSSNNGFIATNVYNSGSGNLYKNSNYATSYNQTSGQHQWYTAASGTAGNAISFTQAMTLDASGNLGVGSTSPNLGGVNKAITLNSATSTNCSYELAVNGTLQGSLYTGVASSSLNLGTFVNGPLTFVTNSSERARIDSSGNLLVGTNDFTNVSAGAFSFRSIGANNTYLMVGHKTGSASGADFVAFYYNTSQIGGCAQNGTTAVSFNTTSDHRLKTNVVALTGGLEKVMALKPSSFTWVDGRQDEGFIAHELQEVLPNVVTGEKDATNEDDSPKYQQVDYSKIVTVLTAAIQEQQAIIESLTARITALEA